MRVKQRSRAKKAENVYANQIAFIVARLREAGAIGAGHV